MDKLATTLRQIWNTKSLRDKMLFTIMILVVFRILAHITIPGANVASIEFLLNNQGQNALGVFSLLTGGAMENFSIVLMGLTPYINAAIIMQLLGVIVPSIETLKKEGESGQKKIAQYTRLMTVPLAFAQSYGMMLLINRFAPPGNPILDTTNIMAMLPMMLTVTAGTVVLMWLGELITEKGIGNGISLLIFAGIVSTVPQQIAGSFQSASAPVIAMLILATVALTTFVVYVAESDRRVPVVYAGKKSARQQKSFLPLKINQAGMIPIIFAISMVSFPSIIAQVIQAREDSPLAGVADFIAANLNPASPTIFYNVLYSVLIIAFTYFYISIVFEPKKIAENIQKRSGFIPGYRPGAETEKFLTETMSRLCFWGSIFLAFVAVSPIIFQQFLGGGSSVALFISGAGIIIVVSVVLDLIRRINAQLVMHDYDKL